MGASRVGVGVPIREKLPQIALHVRPEAMSLFRAFLPDAVIQGWLSKSGVSFRRRVYTPLLVFWAMIGQCVDPDHSCSAAVARVVGWWRQRKAPGQRRNRRVGYVSPDNGGYCRARDRLPEGLVSAMMRHVGRRLQDCIRAADKLWGREVVLVDGMTVSMPDTVELEAEFGKGRGGTKRTVHVFPLARIVSLISLSTGAVLDAAIGAYVKSEQWLLESMRGALGSGTVLVGDSLYGSYASLALFVAQGVDLITRPYGTRDFDLRRGRRLGHGDRLVTWRRNRKVWPPWLDRAAVLPDELTLRLIEVRTLRRGHRPKRVVLVTTLLDPERYSADDIANLYLRRWEIEIDLRHLKSVMGMDILRGKKPEIVRKEIWAYLTAYNLIRTVMWETGVSHDTPPCGVEFQRDAPTREYLAGAHRHCPIFTRSQTNGSSHHE